MKMFLVIFFSFFSLSLVVFGDKVPVYYKTNKVWGSRSISSHSSQPRQIVEKRYESSAVTTHVVPRNGYDSVAITSDEVSEIIYDYPEQSQWGSGKGKIDWTSVPGGSADRERSWQEYLVWYANHICVDFSCGHAYVQPLHYSNPCAQRYASGVPPYRGNNDYGGSYYGRGGGYSIYQTYSPGYGGGFGYNHYQPYHSGYGSGRTSSWGWNASLIGGSVGYTQPYAGGQYQSWDSSYPARYYRR